MGRSVIECGYKMPRPSPFPMRAAHPVRIVTVSPKYQVVIPSEVRERLKLKPGQKVAVIEKDGVVHLIPIRPLKELKGMASGVTSKGLRDEGHQR